MRGRLTNVSIALLSAVFLLSCQDQGTGVVESDGLGPQLAKVKNCDPDIGPVHPSCKGEEPSPPAGDATYRVTHSGDITTDPNPILDGRASGPKA